MEAPTTDTKATRWAERLMIALASAAASWGAVKVELNSLVSIAQAEQLPTIEAKAGALITAKMDSIGSAHTAMLDAGFLRIREHMDSAFAALPVPERITETVVVPAPPDSATTAEQEQRIDELIRAARALAVVEGRNHAELEKWRTLMQRRGIEPTPKSKHNGDGN